MRKIEFESSFTGLFTRKGKNNKLYFMNGGFL